MTSILDQTDEEQAEEYLGQKDFVERVETAENEFLVVFDEGSDTHRQNAVVSYAIVILGDDADIPTHQKPDLGAEDSENGNFHYFALNDEGEVYSRIVYGNDEEEEQ